MKTIKWTFLVAIVIIAVGFISCGDDKEDVVTPPEEEQKDPDDSKDPEPGEEAELPIPVYFLSFEDGLEGATIIGEGELMTDEDERFGQVFLNSPNGQREHYLLLPEDILSHSSETREMSISMWVNSTYAGESADYQYSPLFTAYGAAPENGKNTWPMLALQTRCLAQINNSGWSDFKDSENVAGANTSYRGELDWLADKEWHYYTATFTPTRVIVYVDGVLKNEWAMTGESGNSVNGLFTNGQDLTYICLGGNQAWDNPDNDNGFMYDDFSIYDKALTVAEIKAIMDAK